MRLSSHYTCALEEAARLACCIHCAVGSIVGRRLQHRQDEKEKKGAESAGCMVPSANEQISMESRGDLAYMHGRL